MKIVSFVGKKRSGKDTCTNLLCNERSAKKYALAHPIKLALSFAYQKLSLNTKSGVVLTYSDFNGETDYDREKPLMLSNSDVSDLMYDSIKWLKENHNLKHRDSSYYTSLNSYVDEIVMKNDSPWSVRRLMQTLGTDIVCNNIDKQFWNRIMIDEYLNTTIDSPGLDYFIITDVRQEHELEVLRNFGAKVIHIERNINTITTDNHITEAGLSVLDDEIVIKNDGTIENLKTQLLATI